MVKPLRRLSVQPTGDIITSSLRYENPVIGATSQTRTYRQGYECLTESLEDEVGNGWHYCNHCKTTMTHAGGAFPFYISWMLNKYANHTVDSVRLVGLNSGDGNADVLSNNAATVIDGLTSLWDSFDKRALTAMMPEAKQDLSILNSLYELKDVKTIGKSIGRFSALRASIINLFAQSSKVAISKLMVCSFNDLKKLIADCYLQTRFNILPLKSDIADACKALTTIKQTTKELLDREGILQKRHFGCDLLSSLVSPSGDTSNKYTIGQSITACYRDSTFSAGTPDAVIDLLSYSATNSYVRRRWNIPVAVFHATLEFKYTLTPYEREHALVLALCDKLGIGLNPAIIWNALPWTFVVDWLLGVSQFLNRTRVRNIDPKVTIVRYCSSVKLIKTTSWTHKVDANGPLPAREMPLAEMTSTAYRRRVGDPGIRNWIQASGLSLDEFSLAAALAVTHRR